MAYTDESVTNKLAALSETQDSIVSVAQWIMFHRRYADRTASLWLALLQKSNTSKRLNLIYLANEVVQQSLARQKRDFLLAFEPVVSEATSLAYKNASQEVQAKIRRVVEVWRQRALFDSAIQDSTEKRLEEIDKGRAQGNGASSSKRLGGSLFGGSGGSIPSELEAAAKHQASVSKAEISVKPAVDKANEEYLKMVDPDTPIPTAPLHAARLSALMKQLASAEGAVEARIKARKDLVAELDRLVQNNRVKLLEDETTILQITDRKETIEIRKKEVEDHIMRGMSTPTSPDNATPDPFDGAGGANGTKSKRAASSEVERPEAEGFTPPPPDIESFTPPAGQEEMTIAGDPAPIFSSSASLSEIPALQNYSSTTGAESFHQQAPNFTEPAPAFEPPPALTTQDTAAAAANEFLNNLQFVGQVRQASSEMSPGLNGAGGDPRLKRRKMSHKSSAEAVVDEDILGMGGVDEEGVSALLGQ